MGKRKLLGELGMGEDIGGAQARTDPIENGASIVVLKWPFETVRVQCLCAFIPQFAQQTAQPRATHLQVSTNSCPEPMFRGKFWSVPPFSDHWFECLPKKWWNEMWIFQKALPFIPVGIFFHKTPFFLFSINFLSQVRSKMVQTNKVLTKYIVIKLFFRNMFPFLFFFYFFISFPSI